MAVLFDFHKVSHNSDKALIDVLDVFRKYDEIHMDYPNQYDNTHEPYGHRKY